MHVGLVAQSGPTLCGLMDCSSTRSCPWGFPGKNTGIGCHLLLWGIFLTRDWTHVSCIFCIDRWILYHWATWKTHFTYIVSVQFSSVTQSCPTLCDPWTVACQASLSITNSWSLLNLMSIEVVMQSNNLILCNPLLLPLMFAGIRVFSSELVLHIRWPNYWSFSFNISPSNGYSGLIPFKMEWLDLLAVEGTLKSLLQHHSSKASILWCSAFFMVQLSHPYMTTGKTIALTRWTFVVKVMSLLFNMLNWS